MYPIVRYCFMCGWLLGLGLLSSCSVYNSVFHPRRLGTPPMSPEAKAKLKAAEKARHKGLTLQAADSDAPGGDAAGAPANAGGDAAAPTAADKTKTYNELPAGTRATYDKQGLLKRSLGQRLQANRRQLHHYDTHPLKPTDATKEERRLRKHSKTTGKTPEPKEIKEKEPTYAEPAPDPAPPAPKPAKEEKAPKPKKDKNAPKPDPTQPLPGEN